MTRAQIKLVAQKLFAELGYEGTSMAAIAAEVRIKTPSIYAHFTSKEALMLEVWTDLVNGYCEFMVRLINEGHEEPVREQLGAIFHAYGQYFMDHPVDYNLWARMLMFPPPEFRDQVALDTREVEQQVLARIQELMIQGVEQGEIEPAELEALTNAFCVLKEGYAMWLMFYQPYVERVSGEDLWRLLWRGLGRAAIHDQDKEG